MWPAIKYTQFLPVTYSAKISCMLRNDAQPSCRLNNKGSDQDLTTMTGKYKCGIFTINRHSSADGLELPS
jgi:hypothetical protein